MLYELVINLGTKGEGAVRDGAQVTARLPTPLDRNKS